MPNLILSHTLRAGLTTSLMLAAMAGAAVAGPYEDGVAAYVRGDYATALRLMRPFADQGLAAAQNNLGLMYYSGQGVPQDYAEAMKWYRLAADQGNAPAQNDLGALFFMGQGVPQDFVLAHMWFDLSATQGDQDATENRDLAERRMTPEQIAEAQKLAREWKPKPER